MEFTYLPQGFNELIDIVGIPAFELMAVDRFTPENYPWAEDYSTKLYEFLKAFNFSPNNNIYPRRLKTLRGKDYFDTEDYIEGELPEDTLYYLLESFPNWIERQPLQIYNSTDSYNIELSQGKYIISGLLYQGFQEGIMSSIPTMNKCYFHLNLGSNKTIDLNKIIRYWIKDDYFPDDNPNTFCINSMVISRLENDQWQPVNLQSEEFLEYQNIDIYFNKLKNSLINYFDERAIIKSHKKYVQADEYPNYSAASTSQTYIGVEVPHQSYVAQLSVSVDYSITFYPYNFNAVFADLVLFPPNMVGPEGVFISGERIYLNNTSIPPEYYTSSRQINSLWEAWGEKPYPTNPIPLRRDVVNAPWNLQIEKYPNYLLNKCYLCYGNNNKWENGKTLNDLGGIPSYILVGSGLSDKEIYITTILGGLEDNSDSFTNSIEYKQSLIPFYDALVSVDEFGDSLFSPFSPNLLELNNSLDGDIIIRNNSTELNDSGSLQTVILPLHRENYAAQKSQIVSNLRSRTVSGTDINYIVDRDANNNNINLQFDSDYKQQLYYSDTVEHLYISDQDSYRLLSVSKVSSHYTHEKKTGDEAYFSLTTEFDFTSGGDLNGQCNLYLINNLFSEEEINQIQEFKGNILGVKGQQAINYLRDLKQQKENG
ncbi:hypothetical protein [Cyanobacterium sp. HL-69]|uniref:hypothetical protein n=1 Tax=Cyanobacterium sp. HL-69 TaxID=2054282 RepID=UPI00406BB870